MTGRGRDERVQVALEQLPRALFVEPGTRDQAPTRRLQVDVEVDELRRGAAGHVRPRPAGRQLGQVRQVGQLVEDQPERAIDVLAGE